MTFAQLKAWVADLTDEQLEQDVSFRGDDIFTLTLAMAHNGTPFFAVAAEGDDDGE